MKVAEDIIQERFERLESGAPLADCLEGLSPGEAQLVRQAAALQRVKLPGPATSAVAGQRAAIVAAARKSNAAAAAPTSRAATTLEQIWHFLFAQRRLAAGLALLLLVAFVSYWLGRGQAPQAEDMSAALPQQEAQTAVITATAPAAEETQTVVPAPAGGGTSATPTPPPAAVAAVPMSPFQLFMPVLNKSLLVAPNLATVHDLRGLVELDSGDGQWTVVDANTTVPGGSRLRTSPYSSASLTFYDGSQARLGPAAELTLDEVQALRPADGYRTVVMTQWAGESEHKVQLRHDGRSRYEVHTATAAGMARGTQFRVSVAADGRAAYTVTEGAVDVRNNDRTISLVAGQTTNFAADEPPAQPSFILTATGTLTQMGETWVVAGQTFQVTPSTLMNGTPQIGDLVYVEGHQAHDGSPPLADRIQRLDDDDDQFVFTGEVDVIGGDSWVVSKVSISITDDTQIDPDIFLGDTVRVAGYIRQPEGDLVATAITRVEDEDQQPFEFVGVVQNISAASWTISNIAIAIDQETEIDADIAAGDTVKVSGHILADDTWLAEEIERLADDDAAFTFTGPVQTIAPWQVAGIAFEVAAWTQIDPGIEVGDTVRVSGTILADGTWLAAEIERLTGNLLQIVFVGQVSSIDPWVVGDLPLSTGEDTLIEGQIAVGDWVRVTAWIREDGTWLATHILLLDHEQEQECVTITAVITAVNGDELHLSDGQTIILDDDLDIEGELVPGSVVLITACVGQDGRIVIVSIIVIYTPPPPPGPTPPAGGDDDDDDSDNDNDNDNGADPGGGSVTICHKPGTPAEQTKTLPQSALGGHLGHGDTMGPCP
ncbi:MAG: DUF5666 domain-containing protein [Candidatus Promineifilaceae bacterium]|nr:DUF5666 domain-containing protein [Candidatus Promineifilaceae bacterium]